MPYINPIDREKYDATVQEIVKLLMESADKESMSCFPGHLNYILTTLILNVYTQYGEKEGFKIGYSDYNEIVGMLECCKLEMYRRQAAPYEDKKIQENGDVAVKCV